MRFNQLEYFYSLVEKKNMQAVSEQFFTSPQVVSKAIKQLEEEIGFPLFIRTRSGLVLTEVGADVYAHVTEILKHYHYFQSAYIDRRIEGNITLNILSNRNLRGYISTLIQRLNVNAANNHCDISLENAYVYDIHEETFVSGNYDIIATIFKDDDIEQFQKDKLLCKNYDLVTITREPIKLLVSSKSRISEKRIISKKDLNSFSFIKLSPKERIIDSYLKEKYGFMLNYFFQTDDLILALELVKNNQGVMVGIESVMRNFIGTPDIKDFVFVDLEFQLYLSIVFLIKKDLSKNVSQAIIDIIKAF